MMRMRMKALRRVLVSYFLHHSHLVNYDLAFPSFLISEAPSQSFSPAPSTSSPPPEETPVASSSKATSRRSKPETKGSKSTSKSKKKAKAKVAAAAAVEGEDVEMHDGDSEAVEAKSSDPPEEGNDSGEEELEERKAASKRCVYKFFISTIHFCYPISNQFIYTELSFHSAEVALDRRDEMDVEGWKVGDPYVQPLTIGCCVADILLVYPMLLSQTHSHSSRRLRSG